MGRTQRNQWLAEFESGAGHLENPLFLADVTMPFSRLGPKEWTRHAAIGRARPPFKISSGVLP